jgi:hypothetical protein
MTTESDPAFVPKHAPPGYRYAGPWIRLGMLLLRLRVLDPSGLGRPSFGAAVGRNSPQVLASFGPVTGNSAIDAGLGMAGGVVFIAIGITISKSPTRQGFHNRLAGGTFVVRPA